MTLKPAPVAPASPGLLRMHDLCLFHTAANYDLRHKSERLRSNSDLELFFFRTVSALSPDLFIEAGAKDAGSSRRARRRLPHARVVAFEANPYTHRRFRAANDVPELRVEYHHLALSDAPGTIRFNVRRRADGRPSADGQGSLSQRDDYAEGYKAVDVQCTTLDTFFAQSEHSHCALWIDVEGASEQVLAGAQTILSGTAVAIIEVQDQIYWRTQTWLFDDVLRCFHQAGMVPIARDFQSRYQYNVVFVRESALDDHKVRAALAQYYSDCGMGPSAAHNTTLGLISEQTVRKFGKLRRDPVQFVRDSQLFKRYFVNRK